MEFTFDPSQPWSKTIMASLKRRGLAPVTGITWEKHGPHEGMEYMVFIGEARGETDERPRSVVIYPHAVYWHQDGDQWSRWWDTDTHKGSVSRIPTIRTKRLRRLARPAS